VSEVKDVIVIVKPLLVDTTTAARMCGVCRRYWLQLDNAGKVPAPVRFGKRKLWSVKELQDWVAQGCPARGGRK
jgi:hypothetical protein